MTTQSSEKSEAFDTGREAGRSFADTIKNLEELRLGFLFGVSGVKDDEPETEPEDETEHKDEPAASADTRVSMDFGQALFWLKRGATLSRRGWNGAGQLLTLQVPDANSKMTLPYIYITTVQGDRVPWLASQTDLLAEDWRVVSR